MKNKLITTVALALLGGGLALGSTALAADSGVQFRDTLPPPPTTKAEYARWDDMRMGQIAPQAYVVASALCDIGTPDLVVHDDNSAENGLGWNAAAGYAKLADKFTPPMYPATVDTVCLAFITNAGVTSFDFTLAVYADDGPGGAPGSSLGTKAFTSNPTPLAALPATPVFEAFDISDLNIDIQSGSVYLSAEWDAATEPAGVFLANDESPSTPHAGGYYSAGGDPWAPFAGDPDFGDTRALMIRAGMPSSGPGAPVLTKSFAPVQVLANATSTLTITLNNASQPTAAVLDADLVDTLPAGLVLATPANASTTCVGTLTAVDGAGDITLASGAEIPAQGSCTITADVTSSVEDTYVNTIAAGTLSTQHGANASPAEATLIVGLTFPEPYCPVTFSFIEPISRVLFSDIDNLSDPNSGPALEDFTSVVGNVATGQTLSMKVEGNTDGPYTSQVVVYVDWNQNGDFLDDDEYYFINTLNNSDGTDGKQAVANIVVPGHALGGNTRMRVIKKFGSTVPNSCNTGGFGQAEDYTLTVTRITAPTVSKSFTPAVVAANMPSTLTITLDNLQNAADATLSSALVDTFPVGLVVAPTPNASTTCAGGSVTAIAGDGSVTLSSGAVISAEDTCEIVVDVESALEGVYENVIPAGDLETDQGNSPFDASATLKVGYTFPEPYCPISFGTVEPISRVMFTGIDNTSDPVTGPTLENFLAVTGGAVMQGDTLPMVVEGNTKGNYTAKIRVYIDWDQDGDFTGPNESFDLSDLKNSTGADGKQSTGNIVVPTFALPGETRMRVTKKFSTAADSCNTGSYGQAEDYTLTVTPLPTYTVTPSVGAGDGSISPNTPQTVSQGATQSFTLTPDPGFVIDNVGGTCGGDLVGDVFTTDAVTEDCSVIANFRGLQVLVSKAFDPPQIAVTTEQSTLTITLTNETANVATLTAPLVDTLPADLDIVPGSGSTTCGLVIGGQVVSPAASTITLPAGIPIPAEGSCQVTVQVRSDVPGTYVNTIAVGDLQTDQGSNQTEATASLRVTGFPEIEVDPLSLTTALALNGSSTETLTIRNIGDDDLTFAITEAADRTTPTAPTATALELAQRVSRDGQSSAAVATRANPTPSTVVVDEGFDDITALTGWLQVNNSNPAGVTDWFQGNDEVFAAFDGAPGAYIGANFNNTDGAGVISNWLVTPSIAFNAGSSVSFYTRTADGANFADRLQVRLCTADPCTNVGTSANDVGDFDTLLLDINPNELAGPDPTGANGYPDTWTQFTISAGMPSSGNGRIAFRYYVSSGGPAGDGSSYIGIDRVVVDDGTGSGATACDNPTDIPWLSASPTSGTVVPLDEEDVSVTFDAAGMAPGTYNANICVASNDGHGNEMVVVPVTMEVAPSGQMFEVTSTVNGGNGSISPASVTVDENTTATFTLTPDFGFQPGPVTSSCGGALTGNTFVTGPVTGACTVEATFVPLPFPAPYCNVTFPSAVEPISRVVLAGLDNASSPTSGPALEDFRAVTPGAVVSLGGVYPIEVEGNTGGNYTNRIRVFIDWNRDGVFGPGESYVLSDLVNSTGTDGKKSTGEITVPGDALLGETRMRVIKRFSTVPDPCNTAGFGQAEDYTITINNDPLPEPEIDLESAAFDSSGALVIPSAQVGSSGNTTLDILNIGEPGSRLNYLIRRALAARPTSTNANLDDRATRIANDAAKAAAAGEPQNPMHTDLVTSAVLAGTSPPTVSNVVLANDPLCAVGTPGLVVHDGNGVPDNGYGWNASAGADPKIVDKFTPSTYPATYSTVCVSLVTNAGLTTAPVKVVVFADDGPGGAPGTELGRVSATANNIGSGLAQSFQAFDISSMALDIQSGSVYIGLEWDAAAISGLYIAADETSATDAGGYAYTDTNGWAPIVDLHDEYKAMFIRAVEAAAGPPGVGCDNPSNVPWLSVSPASGTLMDGETDTVTITGNATGMAPGSYEALLCIESNDPTQNRIDLTVKFEVTPLPPAIFSDGFEGDDPVCYPEQLFQDPSFEATDPGTDENPFWDWSDSMGFAPFCTAACSSSGGVVAHTGDWFVWLGGWDEPVTGSVTQEVTFPSGAPRWMNYWLRNQLLGDPTAKLEIRIDGNVIHSVDANAGDPASYVQMNVEVPASYLDGATHTVGFHWQASAPAGEVSGAMIDDVTLDCSAAPPGGRVPAGQPFQALKRVR